MCDHLNETDSMVEFLRYVIDLKDQRIEELEAEVTDLRCDVRGLESQIYGRYL